MHTYNKKFLRTAVSQMLSLPQVDILLSKLKPGSTYVKLLLIYYCYEYAMTLSRSHMNKDS